jgi:hypothetical protein
MSPRAARPGKTLVWVLVRADFPSSLRPTEPHGRKYGHFSQNWSVNDNKLQRVDPGISAELVRFTAQRCSPLVQDLDGTREAWLPGYRIKIVDGNHLGASHHRIRETRSQAAAPLPGLSLAVLDPALMMVVDVLLCELSFCKPHGLGGSAEPTCLVPG